MEHRNGSEELQALYARLLDLSARAEHGEPTASPFLSPRELHYAQIFLRRRGIPHLAWGGYEGAERQRIFMLPEYMEDIHAVSELEDFGCSTEIAVLLVRPSGYVKLSHRDFLGSLLGLGLERSVVGDIVPCKEGSNDVYVFCNESILPFLEASWVKAGNDKIRVGRTELDGGFSPVRRYAQISDTVASPRLDACVSALCSVSREKARELVVGELVEVDHETLTRPDKTLEPPCLVSVRGFGKFRIVSASDQTRKGRYRLVAEKFI